MSVKFLICALLCLGFSTVLMPAVMAVCKKLKARQSILHYVDKHAGKEGTPTMGGVIFVLVLVFASFFLFDTNKFLAYFALVVAVAYALLGFLDDFLKVHFHHNEGLKPYQKIVGQVGIAIVVGMLMFFSGRTSIVFFGWTLDLGFWIVPLVILVLVATANSVNLTDGLDGLAGGVSFVYLLFFGIVLAVCSSTLGGVGADLNGALGGVGIGGSGSVVGIVASAVGKAGFGATELANLAMLCFGLCGGILGFLMFNCFPAKIFMGDTGSLALGGFIGVVAVLCGLELLLPIMGVMFVLSALSDIIQVAHYKRTKKRVFLMAPLHHHFEQKGVHENRIVAVYIIVTAAICASVLCIYLAV